jgi:chaperonin GroEL (HSP60 family)
MAHKPLARPRSSNLGADVGDEFVQAFTTIATVVRTSVGPSGLDKVSLCFGLQEVRLVTNIRPMMVDDVGDVTVTNDVLL